MSLASNHLWNKSDIIPTSMQYTSHCIVKCCKLLQELELRRTQVRDIQLGRAVLSCWFVELPIFGIPSVLMYWKLSKRPSSNVSDTSWQSSLALLGWQQQDSGLTYSSCTTDPQMHIQVCNGLGDSLMASCSTKGCLILLHDVK